MSFIWSHPLPTREQPEDDSLTAALHAAFASLSGGNSNHPPTHSNQHHDHDMHREKSKSEPSLEILVNSDVLCLRGTGVDVNPALLSGNVVLHLHEPTSLKQIVLQFKGKARIPASATESISIQSNHIVYLVCNHEWTFLEGAKGHSHTLKAGRHLFPFQLHLGGSLPSSISTTALGGASVNYKLRATAVRSGFFAHRDITANCPVYVLRGLSNEALEYQQTLEIENTWPEKLMYSIMLPHKAWAAGEKVIAVVKFSPLVKGARVLNVTTTINETIKLYGRAGCQEANRVVATTKHDIVDGKAVLSEEHHHRYRIPLISGTQTPLSPRHSSGATGVTSPGSYFPSQPTSTRSSGDLTPLTTSATNASMTSVALAGPSNRPSTSSDPQPRTSALSSISQAASTSTSPPQPTHFVNGVELPAELEAEATADVVTTLHITIPEHATPSHGLEPVQVSHRIRWSILIGNSDGHTSELRCSLPLLVLDNKLIEEARVATLATRRLLLGGQDIEGGMAAGTNGESSDNEDEMELPSYSSHVRDRVANAYLPDQGIMRVANPWIAQGVSPVLPESCGSSGATSPVPLEAYPLGTHNDARSQLPQVPPPGSQPLDWVNSELLLSLTQNPETPAHLRSTSPPTRTPPEPVTTHTGRLPSRTHSRTHSRGPSPERHSRGGHAHVQGNGIHPPQGHGPAGETFVHSNSTASRHLHGLFHMSMKPFSGLTSGFSIGSRNPSRSDLQHHFPHGHSHLATSTGSAARPDADRRERSGSGSASPSPTSSTSALVSPSASTVHISPLSTTARPITADPVTGPMLLHRAFTETPDYEVASRGFLGGGVPPLESLRGLPSYEEAAGERNASAALPRSRSVPEIAIAGSNLVRSNLIGRMTTLTLPATRTQASPGPPLSAR
ncbi:unnamed protein product [Somion occarium]|uniref:Arrestin C-terminal-like domain-containing protein n=1 Tax=Somion occarium TaxID=3059160 RepID=A0ABP1DI64_9APHY